MDNVVTACSPCNLRKGDKYADDAQMHPLQKPFAPSNAQLHANGRLFPPITCMKAGSIISIGIPSWSRKAWFAGWTAHVAPSRLGEGRGILAFP